jgi:Leucine-rich repeat (LRR) protein
MMLAHNPICYLPTSFLMGVQNVKVLDLNSGMFQYLPNEFGNLKRLAYLDLSYNYDLEEELLDLIKTLEDLKILNLHECTNLEYLPFGIINLKLLQVLDVYDRDSLEWVDHTYMEVAPSHLVGEGSLDDEVTTKGVSLEIVFGLVILTSLSIDGNFYKHVALPNNICARTNLQ